MVHLAWEERSLRVKDKYFGIGVSIISVLVILTMAFLFSPQVWAINPEEVLKKYGWKAYGGMFGGAALSVVCLAVILLMLKLF